MENDLYRNTTKSFDCVNFSELDERWLDTVICNEFCDVEENNMSLGILFPEDYITSVQNLCRICEKWTEKANNIEQKNITKNDSCRAKESLWFYLKELNISVKQVLGVIYFLCSKSVKSNSSFEDKMLGLLGAKLYFCCLRVPGSIAYSVSHPTLFRLCIDCLQVPDISDSRNVSERNNFEKLAPFAISTLESLLPLLNFYQFDSEASTINLLTSKLCELAGTEFSNATVDFNQNFLNIPERERRRQRYSHSYVLTSLAYQGLSILINSDEHVEKKYICGYILHFLSRHILCCKVKNGPIPAKFLNIKNNVVSFICYSLQNNKNLLSEFTLTALKRLCLNVEDKSDFRVAASHAVFTIMFSLCANDLAEFINWLLELIDSTETSSRIFALEVLGFLLGDNVPQIDKTGLQENQTVYLSPIPVIFAILTRCDDVSPNVRTKALIVLSQHMKHLLNVLMELGDPSSFLDEECDEDLDLTLNGEHRSFWYNFSTFKQVIEEINNILQRRSEDNNGAARKASVEALENIICFDLTYLTQDNFQLFMLAVRDVNIIVRKQVVQSMTSILEIYPSHSKVQEYWIKSILPLANDPESTVQTKVLSVIEEKFLQGILSESSSENTKAFALLNKLYRGELLSHQQYLQRAFIKWKTEKKLRPQMISRLENLEKDNKEVFWFFLTIFGAFCKLPTNDCEKAVEEFQKLENWNSHTFIENILKILQNVFRDLPHEKLELLQGILREKLESCSVKIEIMPAVIELLNGIEKHLGSDQDFTEFANKLIKNSMDILTPFLSRKKQTWPDEGLAGISLAVIREFCQIIPISITQNVTVLLKSFVYTRNSKDSNSSTEISTFLRAHAFVALGKICLQDETLSRELFPLLAKELTTSKEDVLRNNAILILIEMLRRYPSYTEKYIPLISSCVKDMRYIIRYQSISLITNFMQQDFVKLENNFWLYCLLSTIADENEAIHELGRYSLSMILFEKNHSVFTEHFVKAIYVFNCFPPPNDEVLAKFVKSMTKFGLPGDKNRDKRMQIYKFMMTYTLPVNHAKLFRSICDVLTSIAEYVFPINKRTESIARDCMAILNSLEIRAYDSHNVISELEEPEEYINAEREIRKVTLVEPIIPIMISLKNRIFKKSNALLLEIFTFIKDLLVDFESEIDKILAGDKMLKNQVMYELRNEEKEVPNQQKKHEKKRKTSTSPKANILDQASEVSANIIQGNRSSFSPSEETASEQIQIPDHIRAPPAINNDLQLPSTSGLQNMDVQRQLFSSTPVIPLKRLKLKSPNISKINLTMEDFDSNSD